MEIGSRVVGSFKWIKLIARHVFLAYHYAIHFVYDYFLLLSSFVCLCCGNNLLLLFG